MFKTQIRNLLLLMFFVITLILTINAAAQTIGALKVIINSQNRIADVLTSDVELRAILKEIKHFESIRLVWLLIYFPVILFTVFKIVKTVLAIIKKNLPTMVLPIVCSLNIILYTISYFLINDFHIGLGYVHDIISVSNSYEWSDALPLSNNSNMNYFSPTLFTILLPALFFCIIPLLEHYKERNKNN
ncbi:MAG: hypothetical protein LBH47_02745 [Christensenellaceae bacterium]|nr:hypothetical protein [Christensenellaceae bacterium]